MTSKNRRDFLRAAAQAAGSATALSMLPLGIRNALAIPANNKTGSIRDVEHIIVLMQENRSFDHYFGTLRGVRGFGDTRAINLPTGQPVWNQPLTADGAAGTVLPFHPTAPNLGLQFLQDLPHDWSSTHAAWNGGRYDQWVPSKGTTTMAYLTRDDMPFHYSLADAFTICDSYHCSLLGPTDPNRYYMWTGWVGNDGSGGGPVIDNSELGYGWTTFPEVLQNAGITWKIYQDQGTGLNAQGSWGWTNDPYIGNYGDNSLLYFNQYRNAQPGNPLYDRARTGTNVSAGGTFFDILRQDVQNNTLPQVSWIVAPEAYSEHPNWPVNYGAWYIDQVLQVLTSNPDLWSKTVLLINYDENDGFFDHVPPPFAPNGTNGLSTVDTSNENFAGNSSYAAGPYGMGPRVPLIAVSPWSKGGWVCSELFDHTSVIRFIEARFGKQYNIPESNITPWRRAVSGDLTSAFNFINPNDAFPSLPSTAGYVPPDQLRHPDYVPVPPAQQSVPTQEAGVRPLRALPYETFVRVAHDSGSSRLTMRFVNTGRAAVSLLVYSAGSIYGPRTYTVEAGKRLVDYLLPFKHEGAFDYTVYGPNSFLRRFAGTLAGLDGSNGATAIPEVAEGYDVANGNLDLRLRNTGTTACTFTIADAYNPGHVITKRVRGGDTQTLYFDLRKVYGWYDLTITVDTDQSFVRRLGGHVETGRASKSDPALGG
ncbi:MULTISPECIES: phosphocholine-specific phospholipase C [Paraburkholderia]|uniref:phospholipase C n=1 Tax=Paraburkholderia megapolitana TaxID=420953 RepID=A0A1I3W4P7_9BURK|nr:MULTISPECIES: phospholipase C, phosphocholine-specific [Paraburkholderia]MCX4165960.1 phospholipase C, phosphocholine-specific [Paraburkholderia megapolitana]MDN7161451.1 phospholipase C, phosphocholine-specific [Paraburkholderia sp. CHISQ3]MDQ6498498.1 phospholipase C, phosphocholine-specific [Paraburkholderia megapolitana]QDQ84623.1 phospholipase C, phosphocholine-specific [Paraburkholderia megapolitana]SFK02455.1 phospholipase C [Paraburkholderia megapolitana]